MRKLLIIFIIALLVALSLFMIWNNISIGSLKIPGVVGIQERNDELETQIQTVSRLTTTDYEKALNDLNNDAKALEEEKKKYDEMVEISEESDVEVATKLQKYEIEYLWTKLGNHATSEGIEIKIDVTNGSAPTEKLYNLNFTATGSYVGITDFIYDIENDSSLGFKIEEFKLLPQTTSNANTSTTSTDTTNQQTTENVNELVATFSCKDISIDIDEADIVAQQTTNETTDGTTSTDSTDQTATDESATQDQNTQDQNGSAATNNNETAQ